MNNQLFQIHFKTIFWPPPSIPDRLTIKDGKFRIFYFPDTRQKLKNGNFSNLLNVPKGYVLTYWTNNQSMQIERKWIFFFNVHFLSLIVRMGTICKRLYLKCTYNFVYRLKSMPFQIIIDSVNYLQSDGWVNKVSSANLYGSSSCQHKLYGISCIHDTS